MAVDDSWMLAFLDDLEEIARQRGLTELARDLEVLIARHSGLIGTRSEGLKPCASGETGGVVPFRRTGRSA